MLSHSETGPKSKRPSLLLSKNPPTPISRPSGILSFQYPIVPAKIPLNMPIDWSVKSSFVKA